MYMNLFAREEKCWLLLAAGAKSLSGESMLELATERKNVGKFAKGSEKERSLSWHTYYFRQARVSARYPHFPPRLGRPEGDDEVDGFTTYAFYR